MPLASQYVNKTDVTATGTAAQLFSSAHASRIGIRLQLTAECRKARVYVGTTNGVTSTVGVLAVLRGPLGWVDIVCGPSQAIWVISDGSSRTLTAWEVIP